MIRKSSGFDSFRNLNQKEKYLNTAHLAKTAASTHSYHWNTISKTEFLSTKDTTSKPVKSTQTTSWAKWTKKGKRLSIRQMKTFKETVRNENSTSSRIKSPQKKKGLWGSWGPVIYRFLRKCLRMRALRRNSTLWRLWET